MGRDQLRADAASGVDQLQETDPALHWLLEREQRRQHDVLAMIASASIADASVLACEGSASSNVTTEGYPGQRFHAGCELVDQVERLAVERAKAAFSASYANVQPHSGSTANQLVMASLLEPGDVVLALGLDAGGHLTHGAAANWSGRFFSAVHYGLDEHGLLDYEQVARLAREHRPKLIVCGASAYPRTIDFARFRAIADEVGAFLLADISHIAGLVVAGLHPSPIDVAHFTTTSTYKQLCGPRGGLVLMGRDADAPAPRGGRTLSAMVQHAVFPYFQGTPRMNGVAAKARALAQVNTPGFRALARRILDTAGFLADGLAERGWRVLTGGTNNHMVLVDVGVRGLTGLVAERALESCGIIVNRNKIQGDPMPPTVGSGVRFGTNVLAQRGMDAEAIRRCVELVDLVWTSLRVVGQRDFVLEESVRTRVRAEVAALCARHPLPGRMDAPAVALEPAPAG
ncbi:serine hydroxymethyltransferase [Amycolatopsis sp. NPDC049253]|uniref:serine hydroxymethyltransferase n=1 Tax=Amycolatopsis sp. NPDC049253 TaxID=3155274 RepID=UPI0034446583